MLHVAACFTIHGLPTRWLIVNRAGRGDHDDGSGAGIKHRSARSPDGPEFVLS